MGLGEFCDLKIYLAVWLRVDFRGLCLLVMCIFILIFTLMHYGLNIYAHIAKSYCLSNFNGKKLNKITWYIDRKWIHNQPRLTRLFLHNWRKHIAVIILSKPAKNTSHLMPLHFPNQIGFPLDLKVIIQQTKHAIA